jgi:pimeloyl-ACP methyl ester carboxylesterase
MGGQCTCYVMDRRGRGRSGDSTNYSLEREIEDIKAVLNAAGPGSFLLGHSSGAIYALEAASRFPVAGLVLYEPPLHYQVQFAKVFDHMRVEAQSHRYDEALAVFMREEAGLPEDQIAAARSSPDWQGWAALMPTMVREWNEIIRFAPSVDRYRNLSVPTLLLTGSETEHHPSFATRALQGAMPDARTSVLEGQGHEGNSTAPDLVAREVSKFLSAAHQ